MTQEQSKDKTGKMIEWQLQLDNLRFENNKLRDKLTKAVSKDVSASFLEEAESFHQKLLDLDQITALMRHEIAILLSASDLHSNTITHLQYHQIKTDIDRCEVEFKQIETAFKQPPFRL